MLNRKVGMKNGLPLRQLHARVQATISRARATRTSALQHQSDQLEAAWEELLQTTDVLLIAATSDIRKASANSAMYLDMFGHHVLAWLWLEQATIANDSIKQQPHLADFHKGKLAACAWFYHTELTPTHIQHQLLRDIEQHALNTSVEWL